MCLANYWLDYKVISVSVLQFTKVYRFNYQQRSGIGSSTLSLSYYVLLMESIHATLVHHNALNCKTGLRSPSQ